MMAHIPQKGIIKLQVELWNKLNWAASDLADYLGHCAVTDFQNKFPLCDVTPAGVRQPPLLLLILLELYKGISDLMEAWLVHLYEIILSKPTQSGAVCIQTEWSFIFLNAANKD